MFQLIQPCRWGGIYISLKIRGWGRPSLVSKKGHEMYFISKKCLVLPSMLKVKLLSIQTCYHIYGLFILNCSLFRLSHKALLYTDYFKFRNEHDSCNFPPLISIILGVIIKHEAILYYFIQRLCPVRQQKYLIQETIEWVSACSATFSDAFLLDGE